MSPKSARHTRMIAAAIGLVLLWSGAGALVHPRASEVLADVGGRQVVVDKTTDLANEVVRVSWTGFRPTTSAGLNSVIVYQCRGTPRTTADCFTAEPFPALAEGTRQIGRTGQDGTGRLLFEVRPAANLPVLGCSSTNPCSLLVFENDGIPTPPDQLPATAVVISLTFAPSQADCPPITSFDLRTDGSASAAGALYTWSASLCRGGDTFVLDYTETSSTAGRENFLEGLVDMGITAAAVSEEELEEHPDHRPFAYAPLNLSAVAVVVNMRDPFTGNQVTDLVLSPRLVTRLVTDSSVTGFLGDPELRQLNPRVRFPTVGLSHPLVRAERNAATAFVTQWMISTTDAQRFLAGDDRFGVSINPAYRNTTYPRQLFENIGQSSQFLPRTGQRNVALRMFYGVRPTGASREPLEEIGFIGIVDWPTAQRFGLPTARLINGAGVPVALTQESVLAGYRAMTADEHGVLAPDPTSTDPAAYPLPMIDYGLVPTQAASDAQAASLKKVLNFAADAGQMIVPPGYVPLPEALRQQTRTAADQVMAPVVATTTTTEAPSTTAAPSTTEAPTSTTPLSTGESAGQDSSGTGDDASPVTVTATTTTTPTTAPTASSSGSGTSGASTFDPNFTGGFVATGGGGSSSFDGGGFEGEELDPGDELDADGDGEAADGEGGDEESSEDGGGSDDAGAEAMAAVGGGGAGTDPGIASEPAPLRPLPESRSSLILPLLQILAGGALLAWAAMHAPTAWGWMRNQAVRLRRRFARAGAAT
jgi:ABC-type phosphate transport system substrate-binding protein